MKKLLLGALAIGTIVYVRNQAKQMQNSTSSQNAWAEVTDPVPNVKQ